MNRIKAWLIHKRFLLRGREKMKLFTYTFEGKKYLVVIATGWRGVKWKRRFEVKDELDEEFNPIQFIGQEAARL